MLERFEYFAAMDWKAVFIVLLLGLQEEIGAEITEERGKKKIMKLLVNFKQKYKAYNNGII